MWVCTAGSGGTYITLRENKGPFLYLFMKKLLYISLVFLLVSCSGNRNEDTDSLLFWSSNNAGEITFAEQGAELWNNSAKQTKVRFQPIPEGQSSEEIILAAVVGKTTPDIYANMWQGSVEFYANAGVLVPLDTLESFMEYITQRCNKETIDEITSSDGHIYQIPWKINPILTIYNKNIFADLSLDTVPMTYSQYLEAAARFKKDFDNDGYADQWFGNTSVKTVWYQRLFNFYPLYLAASGGMPLIEDNKAAFNNEYAVGVFAFLQKLYRENYFSKERLSAGQDPFVSEKVATKFTGPWEISYLEKYKPEGFEYGYYSMLVPDDHTGPIYTYGDPKSIVVFNTCRKPQVAFEYLKTLTNIPGDLRLLEITKQLPRRQGIDTLSAYSNFFIQNPGLRIFASQAELIKGMDNCSEITEVLDILSQEYEACVLYQKKTPEEAISDAEKAVNILLRVKE